jgi:hypothetical protein
MLGLVLERLMEKRALQRFAPVCQSFVPQRRDARLHPVTFVGQDCRWPAAISNPDDRKSKPSLLVDRRA